MIMNPTTKEVWDNTNKADFGMFVMVNMFGTVIAFFSIKGIKDEMILRRKTFSLVRKYYFCFSIFAALLNSYSRLIGMNDNGLKWRRKNEMEGKFDFTKDFE